MTTKTKSPKYPETPIPIDAIARAFNATYQAIGFDLQKCREDCGAKSGSTIGRRELFEVCCDHIDSYGGISKDDAEKVHTYIQQLYSAKNVVAEREFLRAIFPFARYE